MPYSVSRLLLLLALLLPLLAVLPSRGRRLVLLASSLGLYAAENPATHFALLCTLTLAAFVAAQLVTRPASPAQRRAILAAGILVILAPLVLVKVASFGRDALDSGSVPLGLAFVTLALTGYVIDVFRGLIPAQSLASTFAFGSFFPVIPAGPIPRAPNLMPQLNSPHPLTPDRFSQSCRHLLWGLFLKLVVADRLALIIDRLDLSATAGNSAAVLGAAYAYSFRLLADFSAYSEMAIGLAGLCGVTLPKNFDRPYSSPSLAVFWRRWHISLSGWLKDYVYIPLGGSRVPPVRRVVNILIVFLISGFWHGASATFIVWGLMHGAWLSLEQVTRNVRDRFLTWIGGERIPGLHSVLGTLLTFHFVTVAWVVFRAGSIAQAGRDLLALVSAVGSLGVSPHSLLRSLSPTHSSFVFVAAGIGAWMLAEWCWTIPTVHQSLDRVPRWVRWAGYYAVLLVIATFGVYDQRPFIYTGF